MAIMQNRHISSDGVIPHQPPMAGQHESQSLGVRCCTSAACGSSTFDALELPSSEQETVVAICILSLWGRIWCCAGRAAGCFITGRRVDVATEREDCHEHQTK